MLRSCHTLAASLTAIAGTLNSNTVPLEIVDVSMIYIYLIYLIYRVSITDYRKDLLWIFYYIYVYIYLYLSYLTNDIKISIIIQVARRIPPRVDDVVRSLYPPLDARLLEARVAALVLAVTHLALVTKHGVPKSQTRKLAFIGQALSDMDTHLLVLRNAALAQEVACSIPASTSV